MRVRPFLLLGALAGCRSAPEAGLVIGNATIYDGTGRAGFVASVRIAGDRITAVGEVAPGPADWFVDGTGLALAPGFIDTHSHADRRLFDQREAVAVVSQGITTVVVGQDGGSPCLPSDSPTRSGCRVQGASVLADFFARLDSTPAAVNVAAFAGHGTLRRLVMGADYRRAATPAEVDSMRALLQLELDAGALGLSTGLEYDPGIYATTEELLSLAGLVAAEGGRYISHLRSEDRSFWAAVDEIVRIGREVGLPVQISHLKLAMRSLWGRADSLVAVLERARASGVDLTADIYPYTYWQSSLTVLFPERDFTDRRAAEFALQEVSAPEGLLLSRFGPDPSYVGKTVAEIARRRRSDPAGTLMGLIREARAYEARTGESAEGVIGTSMDERDVERLLRWEWANVCTDGELDGRHPRGFGAFPRVLGRYVRDRGTVALEEAIRKMTWLAARNMGLGDRGVVAVGGHADLVLFDPTTVLDHATTDDPRALAGGITAVWVNGEVVYEHGRPTGRYPGRVLRRGQ